MPTLDRKTRLLVAAAATIAVVVVVLLVVGRSGSRSSRPAAGTGSDPGADPWAGERGPAGPLALRRGDDGSPSWLRFRPAGPPVVVTGVVRLAPDQTPVPGAEVAFVNRSGENTVTADGTGHYTIKVATNVAWTVHARTSDAVGYPESFVATGDAPVRDLVVHRTATVRGHVIDVRHASVPGAEVSLVVDAEARGLLESALPLSTIADDAGRFELPALPGPVLVKGALGLRQGVGELASLAPGETAEVVVVLTDPIVVTGRVVDGDGDGVVGAKILAAATIHPGGPTEKNQFDSGEDGRFELSMPSGWLRLEARHGVKLSPASARWVGSGERLDDVELTITEPAPLRGRVLTSDGTPVVGARVRLSANAVYDSTSAGGGYFTVDAPADQPYLVKIRHSDGRLDKRVDAWTTEQVFVMPRFGAIRVVVDAGSIPAGEATVTVTSFVAAGEKAARAPDETTFRGAAGTVLMTGLEPGLYDLSVATPGAGSTRLARVAVAEGETREVHVALTPPVTVRGTVRTGNQPVGGVQITIGDRSGFSDARGRWTVAGVGAGPITVVAVKHGFATAWASGVAGEDAKPIAIELRPGSDDLVEGVGVVLAPGTGGAVVATVLPGSPADGKLAVGDRIEQIDGTDVAAAAIAEIVARLRGAAGSSVSITIQRGTDSSTVDVVRKRLVVPDGTPAGALAAAPPAAPVPTGVERRT